MLKIKTFFRKNKIIFVILLLLFLLVIIFFNFIKDDKEYYIGLEDKEKLFDYDYNTGGTFYSYKSNYFFVTKDGIEFKDKKNRTIWKEILNLKEISVFGEENYILVTEKNGNKIYIFNDKGLVYSVDTKNPITSVAINNIGYSAIIENTKTSYIVNIYNGNGDNISTWPIPDYNLFPISMDISNDGRIFAISHIEVNGQSITSKINYLYVNKNENNKKAEGTYIAGNILKDEFISKIKFMNNNNLIVISDKKISCINEKNNSFEEVWEEKINSEINKVFFDEKENIIISFGKNINITEESKEANTVSYYNLQGVRKKILDTENEITYLNGGYDSIILGEDKYYYSYSLNNKLLWEYYSLEKLRQLLFLGNTKTLIKSTEISASILKQEKLVIKN